MRLHIAAGLIAAAAISFASTSANAVNKPVSLPQVTSGVEKAACVGNRRSYRDFAHCKTFAYNSNKYCNKICS